VLAALLFLLEESRGADTSISLRPKNIVVEYLGLFREQAFVVYTFASAAAVGGFFAYIAGSSLVYMKLLGFTETQFGFLYGVNAVGLIGGSQVNRLWLKRRGSAGILFRVIAAQSCIVAALLVLPHAEAGGRFGLMSLLFCYLFFFGFVNANATALALEPFTRNAGSASALMGSIQVVSGACTSWLVSFFYNGTALPMIWVMTGCTGASLLLLLGFTRPRRRP
jgi:DHA1 family bicyclomycin/chloramphenicol resistance-like MFS transporter